MTIPPPMPNNPEMMPEMMPKAEQYKKISSTLVYLLFMSEAPIIACKKRR